MNIRFLLALLFGVTIISGCGGGGGAERAVPTPPASNDSGSVVTGVITPVWDPLVPDIPLPNFHARQGTGDLTLNIGVDDPNNFQDPQVALNALDGWSTTQPWFTSFGTPNLAGDVYAPIELDPDTVIPGGSVRFFEVSRSPEGAVTGIVEEITPLCFHAIDGRAPETVIIDDRIAEQPERARDVTAFGSEIGLYNGYQGRYAPLVLRGQTCRHFAPHE